MFNLTLVQQEHVLAELSEYSLHNPASLDTPCTKKVTEYLTACNSLFERGILGKKVYINSTSSPILTSMDCGFNYFSKWLDVELAKGIIYMYMA